MASSSSLKLESLRMLVETGTVRQATIVGQKGGYAIVADVGMQRRTLVSKYNRVRMFGTADSAARVLRELGIGQALLDMANYQPGRLRAARPDVKARTERANAALEHDAWFREQVQQSLDKIEGGKATWKGHDAVFTNLREYAAQRTAKRDADVTDHPARPATRRRKGP